MSRKQRRTQPGERPYGNSGEEDIAGTVCSSLSLSKLNATLGHSLLLKS